MNLSPTQQEKDEKDLAEDPNHSRSEQFEQQTRAARNATTRLRDCCRRIRRRSLKRFRIYREKNDAIDRRSSR